MSKNLKIALFVIIGLIILSILIGFLLTFIAGHSKNQKTFSSGSLLGMIPDGRYKGSVDFPQNAWLGKKFDRASNTGDNMLSVFGKEVEKFPFTTRIEKGAHDRDLDVLVLDYNAPSNPWWLRLIRDEIVEVSPGKYLGKVHLRIIPGYPFTVGFFRLER